MRTETKNSTDIDYTKLKEYMVHVQGFLESCSVRSPFVTICLLDCCRVYYLRSRDLETMIARGEPSSNSSERDSHRGIVNAGSLIGFACAPGNPSFEKEAETNGLFTKHLLKHIRKPDTDISKVLRAVTKAVEEESKSRQIPCYIDALLTEDDICLYETTTGKW